MARLRFSTLRPEDLRAMEVQPSQSTLLGEPHSWDDAQTELVCAQPVAWCAREAEGPEIGRIVACFGIVELFAGIHGYGWAVLAPRIGRSHFELTRFIQGQIDGCGLARIELRARADDRLEQDLAVGSRPVNPALVLQLALHRATPEIRWGVLLGLRPVHVLRQYGAARESYVLFERIDPAAGRQREAA